MVYYVDMEGSIWEANVNTLAVKRLFKKASPRMARQRRLHIAGETRRFQQRRAACGQLQ